MKGKAWIAAVVASLVVLGAAGVGYAYWEQGREYVSTDNAQVEADTAPVGALTAGTLAAWDVKVGDAVTKGETLGEIQLPPGSAASTVPLTSPIDGTVVDVEAIEGQFVAPGQVLARIADLGHAYVVANVAETRLADLRLGQKADVTVDAVPGVTFSGTVVQIGRATASSFSLIPAQNTTANYTKVTQVVPVRIALDGDRGKRLVLGESAEVRVRVGK